MDDVDRLREVLALARTEGLALAHVRVGSIELRLGPRAGQPEHRDVDAEAAREQAALRDTQYGAAEETLPAFDAAEYAGLMAGLSQ